MKHSFPGRWLAGVVVAGFLAGCGEHGHDHSHGKGAGAPGGTHAHDSAHGGVAVELGEHQFQLDVVADPGAGQLKAWVMDGHMENFVRLSLPAIDLEIAGSGATQALRLAAQANAGSGETVGDTSQFQGEATWLKGFTNFSARIARIEIRGQIFTNINFSYPAAAH